MLFVYFKTFCKGEGKSGYAMHKDTNYFRNSMIYFKVNSVSFAWIIQANTTVLSMKWLEVWP